MGMGGEEHVAENGVVEGYSTRLRLRRTRRKRRPEKLVMRKSQRDEVEEENAQQKDWVPQTCPKKEGNARRMVLPVSCQRESG